METTGLFLALGGALLPSLMANFIEAGTSFSTPIFYPVRIHPKSRSPLEREIYFSEFTTLGYIFVLAKKKKLHM